jgi:beta-phosphoglucomutase-like phosphatase (HAD superfamily)
MKIEALIFDCDGVLVDSEPVVHRLLSEMLGELGLDYSVEQTMRTFLGKALREELETIESLIGRSLPPDWHPGFVRRRDEALVRDVLAVPGIVDVLDRLASHQLPFAVASGGDRAKMRVTLGATGLLDRFEPAAGSDGPYARFGSRLFGADMVARAKPAPDIFLLAAQGLGVAPGRCAVIEDSPTGTTAGVAAGTMVLGYCAHTDPRELLAAGACAVFDDMRRLPALLSL